MIPHITQKVVICTFRHKQRPFFSNTSKILCLFGSEKKPNQIDTNFLRNKTQKLESDVMEKNTIFDKIDRQHIFLFWKLYRRR